MNAVFLDFNGVLDTIIKFDEINLENLGRLNIVSETGARVVVSSSLKNSFYYTDFFSEHLVDIVARLYSENIDVIDIILNVDGREDKVKFIFRNSSGNREFLYN